MKAYFDDETIGAKYVEGAIPDDMMPTARQLQGEDD